MVAGVVRTLAQRCAEAAQNTGGLIREASERAQRGASISSQVGDILSTIVRDSDEAGKLMDCLHESVVQQSEGVHQITLALRQLDAITQSNAGASEELAAAVRASGEQLDGLQHSLDAFKVRAG